MTPDVTRARLEEIGRIRKDVSRTLDTGEYATALATDFPSTTSTLLEAVALLERAQTILEAYGPPTQPLHAEKDIGAFLSAFNAAPGPEGRGGDRGDG